MSLTVRMNSPGDQSGRLNEKDLPGKHLAEQPRQQQEDATQEIAASEKKESNVDKNP